MSRRPTCCCTSSLPQAPRSDLGNRHLRQHRLQRQRLWRRFVRSGAGPPNTMGPEASRAGCAQACRDTAPMVADRADSIFLSGRILMILLPDRPLRLNVISMPSARRNVCSRRKRPASAQVFLGQPVTVPRSDATAPTSAGTQKVGAATCPGGGARPRFPARKRRPGRHHRGQFPPDRTSCRNGLRCRDFRLAAYEAVSGRRLSRLPSSHWHAGFSLTCPE
jgi:hypothetical protein